MTPTATLRTGRGTARGGGLGRPPATLLVPALLAVAVLVLPLVSLLVRAPWAALPHRLLDPAILDALRLTLVTSFAAMAFCFVLGLPLAWLLARVPFPGRGLLRAVVTVPLVLPPVVAGVSLLVAFGRNGVVGSLLRDWWGVTLPYTTAAVVIAHTFVSLPFFVISVEGAMRAANQEYDVAAATLGASRWTIFRRVTLPLAMPGIVAGLVLAWARSVGEFGATITFAGSFPGTTRTMPLAVYNALQTDFEAAMVLSVILLLVSVLVLALLRDRWLDQAAR